MKSLIKSKDNIKRYQDELWESVNRCVEFNGVIDLITISEFLGFGAKRLRKYILARNEVLKRFEQYEIEGVADIKIRKEIESIGLEFDEAVPTVVQFDIYKNQIKKKREGACKVTLSEAKNLQAEMSGFHEYFKTKES